MRRWVRCRMSILVRLYPALSLKEERQRNLSSLPAKQNTKLTLPPTSLADPLTYDLMRDPVLLPSSKTIVDRSTIKQHYLSDATDPFNRQPLKWEDIRDAVEVREEIREWLEERRRRKEEGKRGTKVEEGEGEGGEEKMKIDE